MFFAYLSSVFIYALPPFIAAVWFPSNEVSRACAFGIFGSQLGSVCGFLLTPFMVFSDCSRKDLIENGKFNVAVILTAANIGMLVLTALTFQNEPLNPPSECQALKEKSTCMPYKTSALRIIRNKYFVLLLFLYGLFVATFITFATMLNETVIHYFP
ncbi:feline leukemia virus subgroup C receptor-related protein 2-like, partial [Stegodyphus dumicola]|uniref:feline leukemia virus subgroup C receptor-related protein 2-like n=1 Tax=Stegodyphus dumicola TaxID=202533 RepID=UPI0015B09F04